MVLLTPLDYKPSVVYALAYFEIMAKRRPDWLSKDVLFLFYPESEYATSVRTFLQAYFGTNADP